MVQKIQSLNKLKLQLSAAPHMIRDEINKAVKLSVLKVQSTAKKKLGKYQKAIGGFPAWAKLSEAYAKRKVRTGSKEDPLIGHYKNSGGNKVYPVSLRNSIETKVVGMVGVVGTNNPLGAHHEYGAPKAHIPPRPFIRPSLYEEREFIKKQFRKSIEKTLGKL